MGYKIATGMTLLAGAAMIIDAWVLGVLNILGVI